MITRVITLWGVHLTSLTTSVSTMLFHIEMKLSLKAIKSHFKESYDKKNLTLVLISYEIYETRRRLVSKISYEMTTRVGSSISIYCWADRERTFQSPDGKARVSHNDHPTTLCIITTGYKRVRLFFASCRDCPSYFASAETVRDLLIPAETTVHEKNGFLSRLSV